MNEKEKRSAEREKCYAKLVLSDDQIPGYIRDLSEQGFRVELPGVTDMTVGEQMVATVTPVGDTEGSPFRVFLEVRWIRDEDPFTAIGMKLLRLDSDEARIQYRNLINYYDRESAGEN